ncbi:hypothetical protein [Kutzneria kofuensis]|uniref:Uncharacterized protein n=1 Tax=Kutzneria kofuensis TaxID=103725 RepID=A0A7W9KNF1_9PSEU|nr:hypothetical protein [Kutzneria kofuensis]MBB5895675.1 hypothetical protein [Kutzneria kofuensis]
MTLIVCKRALAAALFVAVALTPIAVPAFGSAPAKAEKAAWGLINRVDSPSTTTTMV